MAQFLHTLSYVILPLMAAVVLHEYAHGWVANYYGDDTARSQGRLTLNPLPHIDRFGTIIVPLLCLLAPGGFLFGWAKPVPVNPRRLRNPRKDMALVAVAGPAMNFVLAIVSGILLSVLLSIDPTLQANWPPQPDLEPRRDLLGLPYRSALILSRMEPYGMFIILGLFFLDSRVPIISTFIGTIFQFMTSDILSVFVF